MITSLVLITVPWKVSLSGSNVTLQRGERVEGRVVDEAGKGLAGMDLRALSVDAGVESGVRTQEDGSFRFFLQPGSYEFTGIEPGQSYHPLGKMEVLSAATLNFAIPPQNTLRGQATSGQGGWCRE